MAFPRFSVALPLPTREQLKRGPPSEICIEKTGFSGPPRKSRELSVLWSRLKSFHCKHTMEKDSTGGLFLVLRLGVSFFKNGLSELSQSLGYCSLG